ncbi:MAG: hypothetical protein COA78_31400 [Blastopirellula sp.]|nr:MAG: hypothetical protein COA78_31400 [Blastopirellula sp.]
MQVPLHKIPKEHHPKEVCVGCPFGGPAVGSRGDPKAEIVVVTESPDFEAMKRGMPLVGAAGGIFDNNIPEGLSLYVLNAIECNPLHALKNNDTMNHAAHCCSGTLMDKIKAHPRKMIITLGNHATRSVLGSDEYKITQVRGTLFESPLAEVGVMPMLHPSALMAGTGSYRQWQNDLAYAIDLGQGRKPRKYIKAQEIYIPHCVGPQYVARVFESMSSELDCDLETSSLIPRSGYILMAGISDIHDPSISHVFSPEVLFLLKPHIENRDICWGYWNGKFDVKWFHRIDIDAHVDEDGMLMSYALDEDGGIHGLETVSNDLLGAPDYKDMLKPWLPNKKTSYAAVPFEVLGEYLADDCGRTSQNRPILRARIERDPALRKLYHDILLPASEYLTWVEENGAYVDQEQLGVNELFYDAQKQYHEDKVCELAGYKINPGSWQQVQKLLYIDLKYPNRWKGKTGEDIIKKLLIIRHDPILDHILLYRKAVKMNGTYCRGWRKVISDDGRIHCTYKIHGTRTGRLSSAEPNMQNIPRLQRVKDQVCAAPGYELIEVDLSQAELRILAALSKDPILCEIFNSGGDLHSDLAEYLYPGWYVRHAEWQRTGDKELKAKCKEQRVKCKNVNFGIIYGITCWGLCEQIKDTPEVAQAMLDGWFKRYHVAGAFINRCRAAPLNNMQMTTSFGRRKRVGIVSRMNMMFLQNEAANFPPQSIASDVTLLTGIRVWKQLRDMGCKIINTVHDSIIFECPIKDDNGELRHRAITLVKDNMESIPAEYKITAVPFVADAEVGHAWGSLEDYDYKQAA